MYKRPKTALIALAFTLLAGTHTFAAEKPHASTEDLQRIQEELKGVKKKASEAKKQEHSILTELESMDMDLVKKRTEAKKAEANLNEVGSRMGQTETEMETTKTKLRGREADLANRLTSMYKSGRSGGPWTVLISGDYASMLKRYKYLSVMSRQDKRLMDGYAGDLHELDRSRVQLKAERERFDRLKAVRDAEARSVQEKEEQKKTVLASVRKQKSSYEAMARELEEAGRRMQDLLRHFEDEAAKEKPPAPGMPIPKNLPVLKYGLDWPVSGRVISRFGKQKHPDYDTYIFKKGIEVEAPLGAEVRSVEAAQIVFANWFKGLGLIAILRHGGDYYTVYAHLAELRVKAGDKVGRGQVIATIGDTGAPNGTSLYFEVRKGPEAVDPIRWLKRAKTVQSKK